MSHRGFDITNSGAILTNPHVGTHERHESFYDWDFIKRYLDSNGRTKPQIECVSAPLAVVSMSAYFCRHQLWGAEIKRDPPTVTYAEVMNSDDGVAKMTDLIVGPDLHVSMRNVL